EVCGRCVERPPGGPPCAPLGKRCGVEMHLPRLVDAIHDVHSDLVAPYLDNNRSKICAHCALLNSRCCPCPMDYLAVLVVEAAEAEARAVEAGSDQRETWYAAACWLRDVERKAAQAEAQATCAVAAANVGEWPAAAEHARRAWDLE